MNNGYNKKKILLSIIILLICFIGSIWSINLIKKSELYKVEKIVLYDGIDGDKEYEIDITEFKRLIRFAKNEEFIITKGNNLNGVMNFNNGDTAVLRVSEIYAVFSYTIEGEKTKFYRFDGKSKDKWFKLIGTTIQRELDSIKE